MELFFSKTVRTFFTVILIAVSVFSLGNKSCFAQTPEEDKDCPVAVYFSADEAEIYRLHSPSYQKTGKMFSENAAEVLDIVYFAFANPSSDGSISLPNTDGLEDCLNLQNGGTKVLLCVSGVSKADSSAFMEIASEEDSCTVFAQNLMNLVDEYGMDGVDIDWEAVSTEIEPSADGMNRLMQAIRSEMNMRKESKDKDYVLTCAVPCSSWGLSEKCFDFKTLNEVVDHINVMSYDLIVEDVCTHLSPLYTSENDKGYGFGAVYGAELLMERGVDEAKIMIGCAGYGKVYQVSENDSDSEYPGLGQKGTLIKLDMKGSYESGTIFGSAIAEATENYKLEKYTEKDSKGNFVGSWLYNEDSGIFLTYDSPDAVQQKLAYAQAHPGMGIMVWSYTEDTDDHVMNAICEYSTADE